MDKTQAQNKAIQVKAKMGKKETNKYPGYRKMSSAQRHNARMDKIWDEARRNGAI